MKSLGQALFAFAFLALQTPGILADETYQPPIEVSIADRFRDEVPSLAAEWTVKVHKAAMRGSGLGVSGVSRDCPNARFFKFITCEDVAAPLLASFDVRRTDSLITPVQGLIVMEVSERCRVRNVVPAKVAWTRKRYDAAAPHCIGRTYNECIRVAVDAPKLIGSKCTGGPGYEFSYTDRITLRYAWSNEQWAFEREEAERGLVAPPE